MGDLCFNGNSLKTFDPSIGQFLNHIENQSDLTSEEKRAYATSHLSLSVKENLQCDGNGKWQDLRKILFRKYRSRLTFKEKIILQKSLLQRDEESVKEFFDRCMKSQYILHDDIEDMLCDNDVVFSFAIGLKDHIHQKLLLNDNIHSVKECLRIALEIEDNFDLKDAALAESLPMRVEVKTTQIECKTMEESSNLAEMNQDEDIVNDFEEEMFSDAVNGELTYDSNDQTFQNCDSETNEESDYFSEYTIDDLENENNASILTMQKSTKRKAPSMKNKEYRRKCTDCGNDFPNLKDLKKHMAADHENKGDKTTIKCEQCPKTTFRRSASAHSVHVGLFHPKLDLKNGTGKLLCQICKDSNECFKPSGLERHIRLVHFGEKYPTCEFCAIKFVTPMALQKHQEVAHRKITCDICGKEFESKQGWHKTLSGHKKHQHGIGLEDLDCTVCKKSFNVKAHLKKHLAEVHGPKNHMCEQCGKSFTTEKILTEHKMVSCIVSSTDLIIYLGK